DRTDPARLGRGPRRRNVVRPQCHRRRRLVDERRLHRRAARPRSRALRGDGDVHGDRAVMLRALLLALACAAAAVAAAGAGRPGVVLTASPASLAVGSGERRTIRVANAGAEPLVVDVVRAALALGPSGRPQVVLSGGARGDAGFVRVRPRRLVLGPGASAALTVVSAPPHGARPGDHAALVLLQTQPAGAGRVGVRMRIGITVLVRVAGT